VTVRPTFPPIVLADWLPPLELSPNVRAHWGRKAKASKRTQRDVELHVRRAHWPEHHEGDPPRRLTITTRRPRRYDHDNEVATLKAVVDGVKLSRAIWNDSPRYLELIVNQDVGPPCTTLELEELGG
jgi:hypothetical protein